MKNEFKKYASDTPSELQHNIPMSEFCGFDPNDIEEGRIYFWMDKNSEDILKSKICFFILQDRYKPTYLYTEKFALSKFNTKYDIEDVYYRDSHSDLAEIIGEVLESIEDEKLQEVSQEEIIAILTGRETSQVLTQKPLFTIYLESLAYDVYKNMIQEWLLDETDEYGTNYSTAFFKDAKSQKAYLKKILKRQINEFDQAIQEREDVEESIARITASQEKNRLYKEQLPIKEQILQELPALKNILLSDKSSYAQFKRKIDFNIIDGDYVIDDDLVLDDNESLLVKGDMRVGGTLFIKKDKKKGIRGNNALIVAGDVYAKNYINDVFIYSPFIFANDLIVENIAYIAAASRSWFMTIGGKVKTSTLLHAQTKSIEDENIVFDKDFSTKNREIFVDDLFKDGKYLSECKLYEYLHTGKEIFQTELPDASAIEEKRFLLYFRSLLQNWGEIYYIFAGFKDLNLVEGEYGDCYVGSGDQVLEDVRGGSGRYCMCHETLELTSIDEVEKESTKNPSSVNLAYRFLWIQWIFSDWSFRDDGPLDYWKDLKQIDTVYGNGKAHFKDDPHLALYWLLHFGLLDDARYEEVKEIMHDTQSDLIQGAIAFIDDLKKGGTFSIKGHPELFQERIQKHRMKMKLSTSSKEEKVAILLDQFALQPKNIVNLLGELVALDAGVSVIKALQNREYQDGYSYLFGHYLEKDQEEWYGKFIEECWKHADSEYFFTKDAFTKNPHYGKTAKWENGNSLIELIEPIFHTLSIKQQENALNIISLKPKSRDEARIKLLRRAHKSKISGKEFSLRDEINELVSKLDKKKMIPKNFIEIIKPKTIEEQILIIKEAAKQDKFTDECSLDKPFCSYLMIAWIEQKMRAEQGQISELIHNIVDHYKLTYEKYQSNKSIHKLQKKHGEDFDTIMEKYLKKVV